MEGKLQVDGLLQEPVRSVQEQEIPELTGKSWTREATGRSRGDGRSDRGMRKNGLTGPSIWDQRRGFVAGGLFLSVMGGVFHSLGLSFEVVLY